jgi:hypothetical protein
MSDIDAIHKGDFGLPNGIGAAVQNLERGYRSAADALVAHAGGGQANATQLTAALNRVGTVATAADSVKLPVARKGATVCVTNAGAASMDVFPSTGDAIDAGAANAQKAVAAGKSAMFVCAVDGTWNSLVSA